MLYTLLTLCLQQLLLNQQCCMYPCVMLDKEEDNQVSEQCPDSRAGLVPYLCVWVRWDAVTTESSIQRNDSLTDFSYLVRLHRDSLRLVWIFIHLNLEQHRLELCGFTYTRIMIQSALHILGFLIRCWFSQPLIKSSVFDLWLGILGCGEPTVRMVLCHFIYRTWASVDFGVRGDPGAKLRQIPRDDWVLGDQKLYTDFQLDKGQYPKALYHSKFSSVCLHINPLQYRQPTLIEEFWIIPDILELTVYLVTSTHECLIRPVLSTVYPGSLQLCIWDAKVAETPVFWLKPCIHLKSTLWAFCSLLPI